MVRQSYCEKHAMPSWFVLRGDNPCARGGAGEEAEFEDTGLSTKSKKLPSQMQ
jgi:hypothetical protein